MAMVAETFENLLLRGEGEVTITIFIMFCVESKKALDILKEAGAKVDYAKHHVTIPRGLVEEALNRAPKTIKYAARNQSPYPRMLKRKYPKS